MDNIQEQVDHLRRCHNESMEMIGHDVNTLFDRTDQLRDWYKKDTKYLKARIDQLEGTLRTYGWVMTIFGAAGAIFGLTWLFGTDDPLYLNNRITALEEKLKRQNEFYGEFASDLHNRIDELERKLEEGNG